MHSTVYLVSSCLVGLHSRYDGKIKRHDDVMKFLAGKYWLPICPEQLGGLPTPRPAAEIIGGDGYDVLAGRAEVIARTGEKVTASFIHGAYQVRYLTELYPHVEILFKSRSPSCGLSPQTGVTAALMLAAGIVVREF